MSKSSDLSGATIPTGREGQTRGQEVLSDAPLVATGMRKAGWFGQGDALRRWTKTPAATPYAAAHSAMLRPPKRGARFDLLGRKGKPYSLAPEHLAQLAYSIEAQYGPSQGCAGTG